MWSVNTKIWIVLVLCNIVKCQMVHYYGRGLPDGIMFPDQINYSPNEESKYNSPQSQSQSQSTCTNCGIHPPIPLMNAREIDELDSYEELSNYLENKLYVRRESIVTRFGDENERSNAVLPPSGKCRPEVELVPFDDGKSTDHSFYYLPICTRVKRCGGCCTSKLYSCQPKNKTTTNYKVMRVDIATSEYSEVIIPMDVHLSCECRCKITSDSCTEKQEYDVKSCKCKCINSEEKNKCPNSHLRRWDEDNCICVCRKIEECHTGLEFNQKTCSCEKSRNSQFDRGNNIYDRRTNFGNEYTLRSYPSIVVTAPSATSPQRRHKDEDK